MSNPIISLKNLDIEFKTDNQVIHALDKINLDVEKNEFISYSTMEGDDRVYDVGHLDLRAILPEEDVYKPKKKIATTKTTNLENFMEKE